MVTFVIMASEMLTFLKIVNKFLILWSLFQGSHKKEKKKKQIPWKKNKGILYFYFLVIKTLQSSEFVTTIILKKLRQIYTKRDQ